MVTKNILIDINHPAHVHYFRNTILALSKTGINFSIVARKDIMIQQLLDYYQIKYSVRSPRPKSIIWKPMYLLVSTFYVIKKSIQVKPDVLMGFASFPIAFSALIIGRTSIILDDTEHNHLNQWFYKNIASIILTPISFGNIISQNQVFFDSYMELAYLHLEYFKSFNYRTMADYFVSRRILFDATHDYNVDMSSLRWKMDYLCNKFRAVYSEEKVDEGTSTKFHPALLHQKLATAKLYIGEGATMASESACLGIPTLYSNKLKVGYLTELAKDYSIVFDLDEYNDYEALDSLFESIMSKSNSDNQNVRECICNNKIDITKLLIWLLQDISRIQILMETKTVTKHNFKNLLNSEHDVGGNSSRGNSEV